MAKSAANLHFYGDLASAVYRAPKGTTMPSGLAAPSGTFKEVGWLADDGIDFDRDTDSKSVNAYQANTPLATRDTISKETLKFQCLEDNLVTMGLMYPGATPVLASGVYTITPTGKATDNAAWVVDMIDGSVTKRYAVTDGDAVVTGTMPHKSTDPTVFEVTLTLNAYTVLSNNPAYS